MKLRDLAEHSKPIVNESKAKPGKATYLKDGWPDIPEGVMWIVLDSRFLDHEQIVYVFQKKFFNAARQEHPDKVIYFPPEMEELWRIKGLTGYPDYLKKVHLIKKELGAWIVPSKKFPEESSDAFMIEPVCNK